MLLTSEASVRSLFRACRDWGRRPPLPILLLVTLLLWCGAMADAQETVSPNSVPIKALLVSGGCSHDYPTRGEILVRGMQERSRRPIEWTIHREGVGKGDARLSLFSQTDWGQSYDIIVHDHCFPRVSDPAYVERALGPHRAGVPALLIHGSLVSFRASGEAWADFTGASVPSHEAARALALETRAAHPPFPLPGEWTLPGEELYRIERLDPAARPLLTARDYQGKETVVAWIREGGDSTPRVFATTLGNAHRSLADPRFLDLLTRGLLWAVGEDPLSCFQSIPPEDSLRHLDRKAWEGEESPLRLGSHPALGAEASAFQWRADRRGEAAEEETASLAVDGNPATAWQAEGPGSWQLRLAGAETLSLAVVLWQGPAPVEAQLEGSLDGEDWQRLASLAAPREGALSIVSFPPVELRQIRLSVAKGAGFGLREFAVYEDVNSLPSALRFAFQEGSEAGGSESDPQTLAQEASQAKGRWQRAAQFEIPAGQRVAQLIPMAAGGALVSLFPDSREEEGGKGSVWWVTPRPDGGCDAFPYLTNLEEGSLMAWDGEWLWILLRDQLTPVRRALGLGPADERGRSRRLYSLPLDEVAAFTWTQLRLGADGWLYAEYEAGRPGQIIDAQGQRLSLSPSGWVRFRREGGGLEGRGAPLAKEVESADLNQGAGETVTLAAFDGDRAWIVVQEAGGQPWLRRLHREGATSSRPDPDWNGIASEDLADWIIAATCPSQRLEGVCEVLRRRRPPTDALEPLYEAAPPQAAWEILGLASSLPPKESLDWLLRFVGHPDPVYRAAAFLALEAHPDGRDHPALTELLRSADPETTAALWSALQEGGLPLPLSETMASLLATHPDSSAAEMAKVYLQGQGSPEAAFALLDDPASRDQWEGAFARLAGLHRTDVVEGLLTRLQETGDPEWRRLGYAALCQLHHLRDGSPWSETERIATFLSAALDHPRVDTLALLRAREEASIPLPPAEQLARLARRQPALGALAVRALLDEEATLTRDTVDWLESLLADASRDGDLRRRALALLVQQAPAEDYRRRFLQVVESASYRFATVQSMDLLREKWLGRPDHRQQIDWLRRQTQRTDAARDLARETLAAVGVVEKEPRVEITRMGRELFDVLACGQCHNLQGEGHSAGPDLYHAVRDLDDESLRAALLDPGQRVASGYEVRRLTLSKGRELRGWIEVQNESALLLVDRAGNRLELARQDILEEHPVKEAQPGCEVASRLGEAEFESLLAFLRSLVES